MITQKRKLWCLMNGNKIVTRWGGTPYLFMTRKTAVSMSGCAEKPTKVLVTIEEMNYET